MPLDSLPQKIGFPKFVVALAFTFTFLTQADAQSGTQEFPFDIDLLGVWGSAPDDVWAVGPTRESDFIVGLFHYDGEEWTQGIVSDQLLAELFPDTPSDVLQFRTISGNASDNIYAVCGRSDDDARFIVRFDGTQWDIHSFLSSHKYFTSYVDAGTGDVFIGGRGFSGNGTIVSRAEGHESGDPAKPAASLFPNVVFNSAFGFGAHSMSGSPNDRTADPVDLFFATSNGFWQIGGDTEAGQTLRVPFDDLNFFQNVDEVLAVPNPGGQATVYIAYGTTGFFSPEDPVQSSHSRVGAFSWNGASMEPAGDTNSPAWMVGFGFKALNAQLAANRTILGDGSGGEIEVLYAAATKDVDQPSETGVVMRYDFDGKTWDQVAQASAPLNDIISFVDGTFFAVGDGGTVLSNNVTGSTVYVWDNAVENSGDHNFHGMTDGPTNWFMGESTDRHDTIEDGGDFEIRSGHVRLFENAVIARNFNATGSLAVESNLIMTGKDLTMENLTLSADLTFAEIMHLSGDANFWTNGTIQGDGTLKNSGQFTLDSDGQTLRLWNVLETLPNSTTTLKNAALDLGIDGEILVLENGVFEIHEGSVTSHAPSSSLTNHALIRKSGPQSAAIDVALMDNAKGATVKVDEGTLSFTGAGHLKGSLETSAGATTRFFTGSYALGSIDGDRFTLSGPGTVEVESSALQVGAGGELSIENSGSSGGVYFGKLGDLYGNGTVRVASTGFLQFDVRDPSTGVGSEITLNQLFNDGILRTLPGSNLEVLSSPPVDLDEIEVPFTGGKEMVWALRRGHYQVEGSKVRLTPEGGSEIVPINAIGADAHIELSGPEAGFNNLPIVDGEFFVFGLLELEEIEFIITGASAMSVTGGLRVGPGTSLITTLLWIAPGGFAHLDTMDAVLGELDNDGTLEIGSSPGSALITGDYRQSATGVLGIELGGLDTGRDYDQLIVEGKAAFEEGARIRITLIDPNPDDEVEEIFVPRTGDVFSFLEAADLEIPAGMTLEDLIEFSNLPDGVEFSLDLTAAEGKTQVVLRADSTLSPPPGPRITSHPFSRVAEAGGPITFSVSADSAESFSYQWRLNGVDIPGAIGSDYELPSAQSMHNGDYTVVVTADGNSTESRVAALEVEPPPPNEARLLNLSTRAVSLTGSNVLIPGFVIEGSGQKRLLIRAVGATLRADPFNLATALEDPQMTLKRWDGSAFVDLDTNDNWETNANASDIIQASINVGAFALSDSRDAVLLKNLDAGLYTVIAGGVGELTGVAIVELFDADETGGTAKLKNISNRGFVGTGASIMIPGLNVSSEGPKSFLIRAVGPTLNELFGLTDVLDDPTLTVYSGQNAILSNDDWGDNPDAARTANTAEQLGAFALGEGSKDAALVVTLPPGSYTIHAAGAGDTTGTAIVEVYTLD